MLSDVDGFFFDDLSLTLLSSVGTEAASLATLAIAVACISSFLVEWLISTCSAVLLDDEVRRSTHVSIASLHDLVVLSTDLIRELTDVAKKLATLLVFHSPLRDVIVRLLFLESFQNDLIFSGDFHQLSFTRLPI